MVDLKDKKLNEELKKLEKQELPTEEQIKNENKKLEQKEKDFEKRFLQKDKS